MSNKDKNADMVSKNVGNTILSKILRFGLKVGPGTYVFYIVLHNGIHQICSTITFTPETCAYFTPIYMQFVIALATWLGVKSIVFERAWKRSKFERASKVTMKIDE